MRRARTTSHGGGSAGDDGADPVGRLLVACRREPERFGEVYDRTHAIVARYFHLRTRDAHVTAELVSETYAQAILSLPRYDAAKGSGEQWLVGIARNQFRHWARHEEVARRARHRLRTEVPVATEEDFAAIDASVDLGRLVERLEEALDTLTPRVRDAVQLRVVEELDYAEVAARCRCSVNAARVRVARGLDQLAALLRLDEPLVVDDPPAPDDPSSEAAGGEA